MLDGSRVVTVSGLERVVAATSGLHPATVAAMMTTTPQDELIDMSAREWLAAGGDPEPVAALLSGLGAW